MDRIVEGLQGCVGIADDIAVVGRTEVEHDRNLLALMEAAKKSGLVFNSKKLKSKTLAVPLPKYTLRDTESNTLCIR